MSDRRAPAEVRAREGADAEPARRLLAPLVLLALVLAPLAAFAYLARSQPQRAGFGADDRLLRLAHRHAGPGLDALLGGGTHLGSLAVVVPLAVLAALLLLRARRRGDALFVLLGLAGALVIEVAAKAVFHRRRPALWPLAHQVSGYSFPSGHAMQSMALCAILVCLAWGTRARWPALAAAALAVLLVGASRVYLEAHYPSDVVAGWCASLAWVTGLRLLQTRTRLWPLRRPVEHGGGRADRGGC